MGINVTGNYLINRLYNLKSLLIVFFCGISLFAVDTKAQSYPSKQADIFADSSHKSSSHHKNVGQMDFWDLINNIYYKHPPSRKDDTTNYKVGKIYSSLLPSAQYAQQTGFVFTASSTVAFYTTDSTNANISSFVSSLNYTTKKQLFIPIEGNLWTKNNKYNILTDWHYDKFPQTTYGLGGHTTDADADSIDFSYIRLYQTLLKTVAPDFYVGIGYDFDYHWNIKEINAKPPSGPGSYDQYGFSPTSISSGITLNFLYDARRNSINPRPGYYANVVLRNNFTFLGSDNNWQSLLIDARKYLHFPFKSSSNILAFWTYDWFTVSGKPPYLNLVSTGSDTYLNMGRGYIQGRFRGQDLLYLESEYRFGITNNGLLGGVVFANAQSYTEPTSHNFETILPGYGLGLRFKLNKFSKTNIAFDYGFGLHGSQGVFFNLGEVF
jgi:hypothetical protein